MHSLLPAIPHLGGFPEGALLTCTRRTAETFGNNYVQQACIVVKMDYSCINMDTLQKHNFE